MANAPFTLRLAQTDTADEPSADAVNREIDMLAERICNTHMDALTPLVTRNLMKHRDGEERRGSDAAHFNLQQIWDAMNGPYDKMVGAKLRRHGETLNRLVDGLGIDGEAVTIAAQMRSDIDRYVMLCDGMFDRTAPAKPRMRWTGTDGIGRA